MLCANGAASAAAPQNFPRFALVVHSRPPGWPEDLAGWRPRGLRHGPGPLDVGRGRGRPGAGCRYSCQVRAAIGVPAQRYLLDPGSDWVAREELSRAAREGCRYPGSRIQKVSIPSCETCALNHTSKHPRKGDIIPDKARGGGGGGGGPPTPPPPPLLWGSLVHPCPNLPLIRICAWHGRES